MAVGDGALPLQKWIVARLKADPVVAGLVNGRIYDSVPTATAKPYIAIGPWQILAEAADCYDGSEIAVQLDAYSAGPGSVEVKKIGRAVRAALDGQTMVALDEGQRLVAMVAENTQYLVDPDFLTQHAVVSFTALTEPES